MKAQWAWAALWCSGAAASNAVSQAAVAMHRLYPNIGSEYVSLATGAGQQAAAAAVKRQSRPEQVRARGEEKSRFMNENTKKFAVDGKGIPDVDFDVGPSFAGQLPISDKADERDNLFFWFFPTDNEEKKDEEEIVIWLNGGPGCSSLVGLLQENGPFLWGPGTPKPVRNPWSWHKLTNVVWIEQPVTVGFSQGNATIDGEDGLAEQFMGFWKNFIDAFCMRGYRVYIAAESYGGMYGPYISSHMVDAHDADYFNIKGLLVYDAVLFDDMVQSNVVAEGTLEQLGSLMPIDGPGRAQIHNVSQRCGFTEYTDRFLVYPPSGPAPLLPPGVQILPNGTRVAEPNCDNVHFFVSANMAQVNPCYNIYNLLDHCPELPNVAPIEPKPGQVVYFNRDDVKAAIHAPRDVNWTACVNGVFVGGGDTSQPSGVHALPNVIDATQNVIIAQGAVDFIIPLNGILLGIQNMTWGGQLGYQTAPSDPLYVPSYGNLITTDDDVDFYAKDLPAGWGVLGTTHTERGLTLAVMSLAGHMGPQYAPAACFRQLEKLLGRVPSLSDKTPFTLAELRDVPQPPGDIGNGTVKIPCTKRGC